MFDRRIPICKQQSALLPKVEHPSAKTYLETPLPDKNSALSDVEFLALDFETTGSDCHSEAILSMGYTRLKGNRLHMHDCIHHLIRVNTPLPRESITTHQMTDDRMATGMPMQDALHELVETMAGKVLLVHYANIERPFLQAAMKRVYGHALPFMVVCTLALEKRRLGRLKQPIQNNQLRLATLRRQYHLPRYGAHDALEDAIATAELFMAELGELQVQNPTLKLGDVLC